MKGKNKILFVLVGIFTLTVFSVPTFAATTNTDVVDVNIKGGEFGIETPKTNNFKDITITLNDEKYSTGFDSGVVIKDLRGLDDNWELSVKASPIVSINNPSHVFNNVLSISPPEIITKEGHTVYNSLPDIVLTKETIIDDGYVTIAKSNNGSGMGQFLLKFPKNAINLMVTPEMKQGIYESTITWNLMSVPQ